VWWRSGRPGVVLGVGATNAARVPGGSGGGDSSVPVPVWQQVTHFIGAEGRPPVPVLVRLYPLQRVGGRVLLTTDLTVQGGSAKAVQVNPFCRDLQCTQFDGLSLIDTSGLVRFGPLEAGGPGGRLVTSLPAAQGMRAGQTYRFGAAFADPGTDQVAVDLQEAGVALRIPIINGQPPVNLISTRPMDEQWNPAPVVVGTVTTAPLPALTGVFGTNRHALLARAAGATINPAHGTVTVSSDLLFVPGTATLSVAASAVLSRIGQALRSTADPGVALTIAGHTDPAGPAAAARPGRLRQAQQRLTQQRAQAVGLALGARLLQFQVRAVGYGPSAPLVPNATAAGAAAPAGRALNRRIEINYLPRRPAAMVSTPTSRATAASTPMTIKPTSIRPPSTRPTSASPRTISAISMSPETISAVSATAAQALAPVPSVPVSLPRGVGPVAAGAPGHPENYTATITAVQVDGGLTLVSLDLSTDRRAVPGQLFSLGIAAQSDVGAFHLLDPGSGRVFVPAADRDDLRRITGVTPRRFDPGARAHYTFFTAALPPNLTTVDVVLAGLGTVRSIPVTR
jgi:outer membrane protein OmpA-like peptidoglycan-associated protein